MTQKPFESIPLRRKQPAEPVSGHYRVYKNAKEFVRVEAATAAEAIEKSGIGTSCRVEQDSLDLEAVLEALIEKKEEAVEPKTEQKPEEKAPETPQA